WAAEKVDLQVNIGELPIKLSSHERRFILMVLALFIASDSIVNENLVQSFYSDVQLVEAQCFYGQQIATK
ncbi:hypothetical protein JAAARDRAFT_100045, partial [Jaapia argillacea MUCL 33604]